MATPHVSGLVAYLLGFDPSLSPAQVETTIKDMALVGVLSGIRKYFTDPPRFGAEFRMLFQLGGPLIF